MHAYDAALNLCAIALKTSGYTVPKGAGHNKRTMEVDRGPHQVGCRAELAIAGLYENSSLLILYVSSLRYIVAREMPSKSDASGMLDLVRLRAS